MSSIPRRISGRLINFFRNNTKFRQSFKLITGRTPINCALYDQAMSHSSIAKTNAKGFKKSYERLEYLGDAILGMVVAEYLYNKYPYKEEGFLTEIRAKIVNREALNQLAMKIGLKELVKFHPGSRSYKSVFGDCLEALIGAVYLDHGFKHAKKFIIYKLLKPHYDFNLLVDTISNYKSKLLEWSQKENKTLRFETVNDEERKFTAQVFLNDKPQAKGFGLSKKKAEQDAAQKTFLLLNLQ